MRMEINGETKIAGVIGWPIDHSLSPIMHNYIASEMGHNLVYAAMPVSPENAEKAIKGIGALGFVGINVTAPHKYKAMAAVDKLSDNARLYGSVNTVVNRNGVLTGYSTDGPGLFKAVQRKGIEIERKNILVLGAGGVAAPVCIMLAENKAGRVTIKNRTEQKAVKLGEFVKTASGYEPEILSGEISEKYDVVINCTSLGMKHSENESPIDDFSFITKDTAVVDLIYNPAKTLFLREAEKRGAVTLNGMGMLVYQGIIAYEKFMDCTLPDDMGDKLIKYLETRFGN